MRHEIWVHCEKKVFLTSETLGYWEEKLRVRSFLRVHKSFLVNPGQISRIGREMIELEDGSQAGQPLSGSHGALRGVDPACGISGVRQRVNHNREDEEKQWKR